jgi:uncharacterized membrane protein YhfC
VREIITDILEALALLAIALGLAWFVQDAHGPGWALLALGAVILCMSAGLAALSRRKGVPQ